MLIFKQIFEPFVL